VHIRPIDDRSRGAHTWLEPRDSCFYLREYTPRGGPRHSETNRLLLDFKLSPLLREDRQWKFKERAIERLAGELAGALEEEWLSRSTLVPMPPSKARSHAEHDDRMLRLLQAMEKGSGWDIRELLVQRASTEAVHESECRSRPREIAELYQVDESLAEPSPKGIVLFDDILTSGAHFRAAREVLGRRFPGAVVVGVFLARTVRG
jgi:predicted amidophosphoribosyltransferase